MSGEPVLIVDDNPINLKLLQVTLRIAGYDTRSAVDAETALAALAEFRPRLILMDLQLPGMDGFALTRQLKADPGFRDVIIIAITAYAMKGDEEKALSAGCDGYIRKPISIDMLRGVLARHLRAGQEAQRNP